MVALLIPVKHSFVSRQGAVAPIAFYPPCATHQRRELEARTSLSEVTKVSILGEWRNQGEISLVIRAP